MRNEKVAISWTWEDGRIWANCDGRRVATWLAEPQFACFVELLNVAPALGALLLSGVAGSGVTLG